jgi:hypothetical protein
MEKIKHEGRKFQYRLLGVDEVTGPEILVIDRGGRGEEYRISPDSLSEYAESHGGERFRRAVEAAKHVTELQREGYERKLYLANRGPVSPEPDTEIEDLYISDCVLEWNEEPGPYGGDMYYLFPAIHHGKKCYLLRAVWSAAYGYSASGTEETVISISEGLKLIEKHKGVENVV